MNILYGPFINGRGAVALLCMRIVAGWGMCLHGYGKMMDGGPFHWGDSMNILPFFQGLATLAEFGGGLALVAGLLTPIAGFGVAITMVYAIIHFHLPLHHKFVDITNKGGIWELNALYFIVAFGLMICGPGTLSLDYLLLGRRQAAKMMPATVS